MERREPTDAGESAVDGISIDRDVAQQGRGLLVTHRLSSNRDRPVPVTVTDRLAAPWPTDSAKFHPNRAPPDGTIDDGVISYTIEVAPTTDVTITAGLLLEDALPADRLRSARTDRRPTIDLQPSTPEPEPAAPTTDDPAGVDRPHHPTDPSESTTTAPGATPAPSADETAFADLELTDPDARIDQGADPSPASADAAQPTEGTVFAVASAKGGVGKTTTAINLGAAVARVSAGSVLVVEFDLAMANFVDFLKFDCSPDHDPTLHDVLTGSTPVDDAIYLAPGGFDVLPSGTSLDGYQEADPHRFADVLTTLRSRYDYVFIDCSAGVSYESLLPLGLATEVILVSQPRVAAVRDTKKTGHLVDQVGGTVRGVVFTNAGTGRAPPVERIVDFLGVELLGYIPADDIVPAAQDIGLPVSKYDESAEVTRSYLAIAESLIGDDDTEPSSGADARGSVEPPPGE